VIDLTSKDRPYVSDSIKKAIKDAFLEIPEGKTSALLGIYDIETGEARLHFAWKANNTWKVGAQVGWTKDMKPIGYVGIEASW
jgi:hypothetical protein